ncbi:hypothetical protein niasHT_036547 [Heterodera trifolii]|uniref:ERCC1-like central domain-containing protein n=1 Tax=Heterodera trifolii TaxID=157864 RepID=A0ABD2J5A5_9BILA
MATTSSESDQPQTSAPSAPALPRGNPFGLSTLKVNRRRQEGNPVLKYIRNVPYEWSSDIKCDFECSGNCGLLYLALKYHKLHCGYIETRFTDLRAYPVKVLLAYVNVEDPSFLLRDLNMFCYRMDVSLVLCYSVEEAAEFIETFKFTENRSAENELARIQQNKLQRQQQQMNKN